MELVNIKTIEHATHDVVHITTEKPKSLSFVPGQAADVSLSTSPWKNELRAFTFTSLPADDHLEFFIKTYPEHKGVTEQIGKLNTDDTLCIGDVFGDIHYKGEGIFIAGGAGITPFIAMLKDLEKKGKVGNNKLIFANKTSKDVIASDFFTKVLGNNFINVLSEEKKDGFKHGYITKDIIKAQIETSNPYIYLCGPPPMMDAVLKQLQELGIDDSHIVKEAF